MTALLEFAAPTEHLPPSEFEGSNVLPFPIAVHVGFVDREARKIVRGRTTLAAVIERRLAYMYRTQSPPDAAWRDAVLLEDALVARCSHLREAEL